MNFSDWVRRLASNIGCTGILKRSATAKWDSIGRSIAMPARKRLPGRAGRGQNDNQTLAGYSHLEARVMLAGVSAELIGRDLYIRGDNRGNEILVESLGAVPGRVRISSSSDFVNREGQSKVFDRVHGDIIVYLVGGNDRLTIQRLNIQGRLIVDGGGGRNIVAVNGCNVSGNTQIRTGDGSDSVHLVDSVFAGWTRLETEGGNDHISLDGCRFQRKAEVYAGQGDDVLHKDSRFDKGVRIRTGPGRDLVTHRKLVHTTDFQQGRGGWQAGFADYPPAEAGDYQLRSGIRQLPNELGTGKGFLLSGMNRSDDLFMYLKKRLGAAEGIRPNQKWRVRFEITFASQARDHCVGVGGPEGEGVVLKAGASAAEPTASVDELGWLRMNIDKGNQSMGGRHASVVGNIANGVPCDDPAPRKFVSMSRTHVHEFTVNSGRDGQIWLIVGTDSGFESTTTIWFQKIKVSLTPA